MPLNEITQQLSDLYNGCCTDHSLPDLSLPTEDEFVKLMVDLIMQVWTEKGMPAGSLNKAVTIAFAEKLWNGVVNGFGLDFGDVDYDTPDYTMLKALQENVWQFSAAKNYTQLRELSDALVNSDGKLRTFSEFKLEAFKINNKHINQYLKTEYELAVTGGQMCSKWVNIQANADTLPILEFDAIIDSHTTELCRSLNGTRLPFNHPFWKTYYLPNHFGERSTIRQLASGKITPEDKIPSADIPAMFKTNLAEDGLIFPKDHPYFIDNPNDVKAFKPGKR